MSDRLFIGKVASAAGIGIPPQAHRFSFAGARVQIQENLAGQVTAIYHGETRLNFTQGVTLSFCR